MEKQKENNKNTPIVETKVSSSKDGKYIFNDVLIRTIYPTNYYKKVLEGALLDKASAEFSEGAEV